MADSHGTSPGCCQRASSTPTQPAVATASVVATTAARRRLALPMAAMHESPGANPGCRRRASSAPAQPAVAVARLSLPSGERGVALSVGHRSPACVVGDRSSTRGCGCGAAPSIRGEHRCCWASGHTDPALLEWTGTTSRSSTVMGRPFSTATLGRRSPRIMGHRFPQSR